MITRNIFYRNGFDPYSWSWQGNNSSWDILNVLRAFYVFFPENILWPKNSCGNISFKLSDFTTINNITHTHAHDASSDVIATIEVAKLLFLRNKKFFLLLYNMSHKKNILYFISKHITKPFFYLSSFFGANRHNIGCVMTLGYHPINKNIIIIFDLQVNIKKIFLLYIQSQKKDISIKDLFLVGVKCVYLNKSPMLFDYNSLSVQDCIKLNIDYLKCQKNFLYLYKKKYIFIWIRSVFLQSYKDIRISDNIDLMLYCGFFHKKDQELLNKFHKKSPIFWNFRKLKFIDQRLYRIFFRLYSRNFFKLLNLSEKKIWQKHCKKIINEHTVKKYFDEINSLKILYKNDVKKVNLLQDVVIYVKQLLYKINHLC